jgi:hypothetical protein
MKAIILPLLPGKTEAWRRFSQELEGSRAPQFEEWCLQLSIEEISLSLVEELKAVIIRLAAAPECKPALAQTPFHRWLRKQTQVLHGIDLFDLLAGFSCEDLKSTADAGRKSAQNSPICLVNLPLYGKNI